MKAAQGRAVPFLLLLGAGCVTSGQASFPTYEYQGIDLLAPIEGSVHRDGSCLRVATTSPPNRDVILVLPRGTRVSNDTVVLPARNGGAIIRLGEPFSGQGGFDVLDESARHISNPTSCSGPAFVLNKVDPNA